MLVQLELLLLVQVKGEEGSEGGSPENTAEQGDSMRRVDGSNDGVPW